MSGSVNALGRFGVPDRPFQPVVGQYGGNSFFPQPGVGVGADDGMDAPMPGQPVAPMGPLTGQAPLYSGADPMAGFNAGPANTGAYDRGIPSPNQTWGGVMDALANAAMFALSPIGFAAGFMGTAAANPQATMLGQPALNAFGVPTATEMFTGTLPGAAFDRDGNPMEGAMFGAPPGGFGAYNDPTFGMLPEVALNGIPNPAPNMPGLGGGMPSEGLPGPAPGSANAAGYGMGETGNPTFPGAGGFGLPGAGSAGGDMGHDSPGGAGSFRYGGYIEGEGAMPATVHGGEYVIRPEAVQRYGRQTMEALNEGRIPRNALAKYGE